MIKNITRWSLLCLLSFVSVFAQAQSDVTAVWDFEHDLPAGICEATNYQKVTADIPSTVEGIVMHVDATNGKLYCIGRNNAQFNQGTKLQVPVKSTRDTITVKAYPGYGHFTISGVQNTADEFSCKATTADVARGYAEVEATGNGYIYGVKVVHVSAVQEKELYSTTFTDWGAYETGCKESETVVKWNTKYSHEELTFTVFNTQIGATNWNTGKFPNWEGGFLMAAKSENPYIITSALASITRVHFMHGATGSKRGWKLWAKGDGDADWVVISDAVASNAQGTEVTADINRTNCQLKFTNLNASQNAYLMQLDIYGNVDMSKTPALGAFSVNGKTYQAADIFEEDAAGNMVATVEIAKAEEAISESNPLKDVTADNGDIKSIAYETVGDVTNVTIVVSANGTDLTYKLAVVRKPFFTLTYYNIDGTELGTQSVEKDAAITEFATTVADVTVAEGKKFRGWFVSAKGGRKYTTEEIVLSDLALYAVVTDIEVESPTARYSYPLNDKYFYIEDHEAINITNGSFHDTQHGWQIGNGGTIELLVGGNAYIMLDLCRYTNQSSKVSLYDTKGELVNTISGYVSNDGQSGSFEYKGEAGKVTLKIEGGIYLHKLTIANVATPIEKNAQGYYVVRPGDAGHLITTLEIANATSSAGERTMIFLPDGTYDLGNAVLTPISGKNISLIGQSMDGTIIVNEAEQEGIGVSATFLITGENTYIQDVTLKNAYDYYQPGFAGRAVVIQDKGKRTICKNVRMLSYQDTYYSNNDSQYYFETSDIHGTVDFICGGGDVFFNKCTLTVEPRNADGSGECTLTAPATSKASNPFGYVFSGCTIDSKAQRFNYGRAWSNQPRCAYINTTLLQPDRLNSNRWTAGGMNVPADKFVEYNTMDADGKIISPESKVITFTKDSKKNEMETILKADEAAAYALDKVFTNWTPGDYAAQKTMSTVAVADNKLTWTAVDGVSAYAVFKDGVFLALTSETSYAVSGAGKYSVRAANGMGGFGEAAEAVVETGIENVNANAADVAKVDFYTLNGVKVNNTFKGMLIEVKTLSNGEKVTTKVIR